MLVKTVVPLPIFMVLPSPTLIAVRFIALTVPETLSVILLVPPGLAEVKLELVVAILDIPVTGPPLIGSVRFCSEEIV